MPGFSELSVLHDPITRLGGAYHLPVWKAEAEGPESKASKLTVSLGTVKSKGGLWVAQREQLA